MSGSNAVILREDLGNGYCNYRFVRSSAVRQIKALGSARDLESLPSLSTQDAAKREEELAELARNRAHYGVGVTRHAQELFDALRKTMDCEWRGSVIRVMNTVAISKPHRAENCSL